MNNRNIVLTGGTGHLGSKLTKILLEKNYKVKLLIRKRSYLANYLEDLGAELHLSNLNNQKSYEKVLKQCGAAFHLASDNTMEIRNRNKTIKNTFGITTLISIR